MDHRDIAFLFSDAEMVVPGEIGQCVSRRLDVFIGIVQKFEGELDPIYQLLDRLRNEILNSQP